jgi:hypothetical protein
MPPLLELLPATDFGHGLPALLESRTPIAERKDLDFLLAELDPANPDAPDD